MHGHRNERGFLSGISNVIHIRSYSRVISFHFQGKRKKSNSQSQLTRESYPTPGKPQAILRPDPCSVGPVYRVAVIRGTGEGAAGAEQLYRNNYSPTFVSQNSVIRWAPSCMNQNNQNFSISPASMYNHYQNNMMANGYMIRENREFVLQPEINRKVWSSQQSGEDVRSETEKLSQNFDVVSLRASYANRHEFENIRSIQDTDLFREAFGLLSDYWIFKVFKNQIFINNKVRTTLKIL